MMSVWNQNPRNEMILQFAGLTGANLGRFLDCYCELGEGDPIVVIRNRNGGSNRGCCYNDPSVDCQCGGCVVTYAAERFPTYLEDCDDLNDNTYAYISFRVLPEYRKKVFDLMDSYNCPE